jgi:hypothetical protein
MLSAVAGVTDIFLYSQLLVEMESHGFPQVNLDLPSNAWPGMMVFDTRFALKIDVSLGVS